MQETLCVPGAPDWSQDSREILCPLCDYNLRGLTEPRCPECGHSFDWSEVLDPARQRHPYLFEHHPENSIGSFFRTLAGSLRPRRFWRTLRPTQPSRPGRLLVYGLVIAAAVLVPLAAGWGAGMPMPKNWSWSWQTWRWTAHKMLQSSSGGMTWTSLLMRPLLQSPLWAVLTACTVTLLAWPVVTFSLLSIFQASMRRARIRSVHVIRCLVYSYDMLLWLSPPLAIPILINGAGLYYSAGDLADPLVVILPMVVLVAWLLLSYRLCVAYRHYLRFQHAVATVLSSQIILALIIATILFVWGVKNM